MNLNQWIKNSEDQSFLDSLINPSRRGNASRPLPSRIFVPTTTMSDERDTNGFLIRLHISGVKIPGHLLWHLLFKGSTVMDWFLLHEFLFRNQKNASKSYCACLSGVLSEGSKTRMGLHSFQHQMKPIHKGLRSLIPREDLKVLGGSLLDLVISQLEIPQKGLPKDKLYTVIKQSLRDPVPPSPQWRGVGYKDKGSMGDGFPASLDEIIDESLGFDSSDFLSLWSRILNYFQIQS